MADNTLSSAAALLNEFLRPLQKTYPMDHVALAQWSGVSKATSSITNSDRIDSVSSPEVFGDREHFAGKYAKVPIDPIQLQGGGWVAEGGTVNVPIAANFTEAHVNLCTFVQPLSITIELQQDSMDNSSAQALAKLMDKARDALAENVNDALNTDAALLAQVASNSGSAGLTIPVVAGTDFDKLYVGKVVDVLTRSNGADPGSGKRRLIASFAESGLTVTFSTTSQAFDGGSGNITFSVNEGIYTAGSYGNAMYGFESPINAGTGTFEGVNLSTYPQWKPIDGRAGVTGTAPLSDALLDAGVLLGLRGGASGRYDWGIGDPSAINVYKNGKQSQVLYDPQVNVLPSGFSGIVYEGTGRPVPLIGERKHKPGSVRLVRQDMATSYGHTGGPEFDNRTGSIMKQLDRTMRSEVWLYDRINFGWHDPSKMLYFNNLSTS